MNDIEKAKVRAKKSYEAAEKAFKGGDYKDLFLKSMADSLYLIALKEDSSPPLFEEKTSPPASLSKNKIEADPRPGQGAEHEDEPARTNVNPQTGEVLPRGFRFTPDCPKGAEACKIDDRQAQLSNIRFRKTLCSDCFKSYKS